MATLSTTAWTLDLAGIARAAGRLAGVLGPGAQPSGDEVVAAGEFLNLRLQDWQNAAKFLRQEETVTTTVTAGSNAVSLASDTIDVEFPITVTLTSGQYTYIVERSTFADYQRISNKDEEGVPEFAYIKRETTVSMILWPVPNSSVVSVTYKRVKLLPDVAAGYEAPVHKRYLAALTAGVAIDFAEMYGKDADKIMRLEARYAEAKRDVLRDNIERGSVKFSLR